MQCFSANCRMAGPAYTLRVHTADILMVGKALSDCPPGHVLVIDGQGERNTALWGAITTECARLKGVEGIVIDGAIRDLAQIRRSPLPVFALRRGAQCRRRGIHRRNRNPHSVRRSGGEPG